MSILIEQDSEIEKLQRGTRRFLLFGLLATLLIVVTILVRQGLFRPTASLGFVTESAHDITKGQAVKIAGFRVGAVESVSFRSDGHVDVALVIDADAMRFVTYDALVELHKEGLVGSAVLEIVPGADKTRLAVNEAKLKFSRADGLSAMANSLRDKIMPVLDDIKLITGTLADPQQGLPATLTQVRQTTASLNTLLQTGNQQVGTVGQAVTRVMGKTEAVMGKTEGLMGDAQARMTQVGQTLETVNTRLPVLLDKTQGIADHLEKITADAQTSVPPVLRDGGAVAADVREIITGAKDAWPIRNLIAEPAVQKLKADSDPRTEATRAAP
jgi:ABC-type transporter Mla subunit MlaD